MVILSQTTCSKHIALRLASCGLRQNIYSSIYKNDPGQRRAGATTVKKYPGIISNKVLIRRTLHEMSVYTHCVDNMAEGSVGMA